MHEANTPLIRLAKRDTMSRGKMWAIRAAAFVVAILIGAVIFLLIGNNPISAYGTILTGSLGKKTAIRQTVRIAIPLLGTALAIAPCFKMKFWNIGAEGQITAGAVGATWLALHWADSLPAPVLLPAMALAGALFGGVWALIPAFFKTRWDTNETLFTLMMNYIAIGIVNYLQGGPWEGRPGSQIIPQFGDSAVLPKVLGVHCGWIIVLLLTVLMYFYMKYTKQGYEIAVVGESQNTARYAGMNVSRIVMRTMFLSGALSGIVGFVVCSGADNTLHAGVAAGVGFTAITVAWLAQLHPFAMVGISVLLAVLEKGASTLQTRMAVPASISDIITGVILFCMLGCEFFINYQVILRGRHKEVTGA